MQCESYFVASLFDDVLFIFTFSVINHSFVYKIIIMSITCNEDIELVRQFTDLSISVDQKRNHSENYHKLSTEQYKIIQKISKAHIDSFDYMIDKGLVQGIKNLHPAVVELPNKDVLTIKITRISIGTPLINKDCVAKTKFLYPAECRMKGTTYEAPLTVSFCCQINDTNPEDITDVVGEIPIMLKSKKCNLHKLSPKEMVKRFEDAEDMGGYFVINGNEKVMRLLIAQRRNYPMSIKRSGWKEAGQLFSEHGVMIRCVRSDEMGLNMVLHYLNDGTARLRFFHLKQLIYLPLVMVLKALCDVTDKFIFQEMIKGREKDSYYKKCIKKMLRLVQEEGLHTQEQIKKNIGQKYRGRTHLPESCTDIEVANFLLKESIAIHLTDNVDKFNLLVFMTKKLYMTAKGECARENPDNPMFQELYLSGHIYFNLLLDRLDIYLELVGKAIKKHFDTHGYRKDLQMNGRILRKFLSASYGNICRPMKHLLSTGNLQSRSGIGLMQNSGLSITAEKINFWRFLAHFRSVHRGSAFTEQRTTEARKLYPEAWGFMCPVHTPDGEPCGLLTHLADLCFITNYQPTNDDLVKTLVEYGMTPKESVIKDHSRVYYVLVDGKVVGYISHPKAIPFVKSLRIAKCEGLRNISPVLEVGLIPSTDKATQYPGVFIFTNPARMVRPVMNLEAQKLELIGTFEQVYMDIAIVEKEVHQGVTTHLEISQTSFLSILASLIPYPDFNQSPRNMYACQMGKQTMGTASHTLRYRSDTKMYSLMYPQSPLVRPKPHDAFHLDDYPIGTNAVVAVISYTGYDMEDALILNKSAVERGFKFGAIYKTVRIDLKDVDKGGDSTAKWVFGRQPKDDEKIKQRIDRDGLPYIGYRVEYDDPICCFIETNAGVTRVEKYKSTEIAYISDVKVLGRDNGKEPMQSIAITFYVPRRPIVGDKFANRHGQKGVCSFLWPCENMPFTGEGIVPDVVFNPHGYPSRMTIGMMLESMAGKSSSCHGIIHDATPFMFSEDEKAGEYYGDMLRRAGYNYYGTEMMYSGIDGRPLKADIFIGVIFYIRLRHMVGDKYQVRSTGPIDSLTHQPVKGRKRCGGIRFGEMERDSLLAHGASFLIHDRLFTQSDKAKCYGCSKCGMIISTSPLVKEDFDCETTRKNPIWYCRVCHTSDFVKIVELPYALKYLTAELSAVNVKLQFTFG